MAYKTNTATKNSFLISEKAKELREELLEMVSNPLYNTHVATSFNPDITYFAEKHMKYMSTHLNMDHSQYVKNLKLMTRLSR